MGIVQNVQGAKKTPNKLEHLCTKTIDRPSMVIKPQKLKDAKNASRTYMKKILLIAIDADQNAENAKSSMLATQ